MNSYWSTVCFRESPREYPTDWTASQTASTRSLKHRKCCSINRCRLLEIRTSTCVHVSTSNEERMPRPLFQYEYSSLGSKTCEFHQSQLLDLPPCWSSHSLFIYNSLVYFVGTAICTEEIAVFFFTVTLELPKCY